MENNEFQDREYFEELKSILELPLTDEEKKERLLQYHESDIAELLEELEPQDRDKLYKILGNDNIADVFTHAENVEELVSELEPEKAADIIENMDADDAIDLLEELPEEQREEIVSLMDEESREDIKKIYKYEDSMIGSHMTNNFIKILISNTVKEAMKRVVQEAADNDNVSIIYVVNDKDQLYGVLELRDLIIERQNTDLKSIIKLNYPYFRATEPVEDCLVEMKEYGLDSYAILDKDDVLVGVITSDDVTEAVDDSLGEDYAKLAGLTEEEDIDEGVLQSVKKRLPWLIVLLALGLVQSFTMTGFESVIAALPIIVFFQTLVLDMAGNAGTQSLAVTIRLISGTEEGRKQVRKMIFKELRVGFFNGLILGTISFLFVFFFLWITKQGVVLGNEFSFAEALRGAGIVGIALFSAMTVSSLVGSFVPVIFMKIHIDPAVASGPFITTINDITALLIYYGMAMLLFNLM